MPKNLVLTQGQYSAKAIFGEPELGIFRDATDLCKQLLRRLGPLGLKLSNIKVEPADESLAAASIRCYLFDYAATLHLRAERIEISASFPNRGAEVSEAFLGALDAVKAQLPDAAIEAFVTDIGIHGTLTGATASEYLDGFTRNIPLLGPSLGAGVVFYFGPDSERIGSTFTIDRSANVEGGLFVRSLATWDGSKLKGSDLDNAVTQYLRRSLEAVDLSLQSEKQR